MTAPVNKCVTDEHKTATTHTWRTMGEPEHPAAPRRWRLGWFKPPTSSFCLQHLWQWRWDPVLLFGSLSTRTLHTMWAAFLFRREQVLKLKPTAPPTAMRSPDCWTDYESCGSLTEQIRMRRVFWVKLVRHVGNDSAPAPREALEPQHEGKPAQSSGSLHAGSESKDLAHLEVWRQVMNGVWSIALGFTTQSTS